MANVLSLAHSTPATDEFVEALNGLVAGIVSLDFVRRAVAAALVADQRSAAIMQSLMDDAYQDGRLGEEDYEVLTRDVGLQLGEDVPTAWSEEVVNEVAPASDTADPGDAPAERDAGAIRPSPLYPGAVLGHRYVLQGRLQTGGMSEVFKALDRRSQEDGAANPWLALKLVSPANKRFTEALKLLESEAALARQFDHPHIVRVHGFERDAGHAFITMEWLDGESLGDLLTRQRYRPLTVARARQIMGEIGSALVFAHARGVAHADVKPGNIFLTRDGTAKLLDFGSARSAGDAAAMPAAGARTPAYASCEVLEGRVGTPQDDVYSLACVAYRMLAGRRVFGHHDALAAEAAGRRPAPIRSLSEPQQAALARALAFRRDARTPDMATFLRDFSRPAPVARPAAAVSVTAAARSSLKPRFVLAGFAASLLAAAFVIWVRPAENTLAPDTTASAVSHVTALPAADAPVGSADTPAATRASSNGSKLQRPKPVATRKPPVLLAPPAVDAPVGNTDVPAAARPSPVSSSPDLIAPPAVDAPIGSADTPAATRSSTGEERIAAGVSVIATGTSAAGGAFEEGGEEADVPRAASAEIPPSSPDLVPLSSLKFRRYVEPLYRRQPGGPGPAGWVELAFTVGTDGETRDIRVLGANPPDRYENAALAAVKRWRFVPATNNGRTVERHTGVRLRIESE